MQRLIALEPEKTTGKSKDLFNTIQSKLGMVPNMMRTMGNSPAVLNGYLSLSAALGEGKLGARLGELIALTVANANACSYCNAAHSFIAEKLVHVDVPAIDAAREGRSSDEKIQAALGFAQALVQQKGQTSDEDIQALKAVGYTDETIAEIIAHVGLNILTNYFNNAAKVSVDFPEVALVQPAVV
ncbi:carboxymuconolactone decarboxylase family protein [Pedobacter sp. SYSU D00535]|uniref:carboxymuconolactone decarboxylase family protein n=1 Tax=Pedobacter sp. SYSU D00535 TaxID=2810308 RepID=UPI001A97BD14|nr:carboxymuconolactone decarboxylase family protein [Pedobacter sp. SYSU D00535]